MSTTSLAHEPTSTPTSIAEAERLILELTSEIENIQAQLANKNHTTVDGIRLSEEEYHEWRYRAIWAHKKKVDQRRRLKAWVRATNLEATRVEAGVDRPTNTVELMGALVVALKEAAGGGRNLNQREQALVRLAEHWIRTKGAPAVVMAREKVEAAS